MSTGIDELIGAEVERTFADEPPLRDPREYVARGRRAQRRRRSLAAFGVGVAAAAVLAWTVTGSHGGGRPRGGDPAGALGAAVKMAPPVPVDPETAAECRAGRLGACHGPGIGWDDVHLDRSGHVVRGYPEVRVTGYYDHVLGDAYGTSAALEVSARGNTVWILLTAQKDGSTAGFQLEPPDPSRTFDEWVVDSIAAGRWFGYANGYPS